MSIRIDRPDSTDDAPHPLEAVQGIGESLAGMFKASWITTVEAAVSALSSQSGDIPEAGEFLARAREILGEERYSELSTPVAVPPMGCLPEGGADGKDEE